MSVAIPYDKASYDHFIEDARAICKDRVFSSKLTTYAYSIDASCYAYTPKVVIVAHNEKEVTEIIKLANIHRTPITFRAAGSSLSGQVASDSVLVIANDGFKDIYITENGDKITLDCGVIGSDANVALKSYKRKIGPDPATINTALIGGIVNNNSSGMCCGIEENTYKTIDSIRVVLGDGTLLDTGDPRILESFMQTHKHIVDNLLLLRNEILQDEELKELIRHKYKIKNTTGFSLNALLDFDNIKDILNHVIVGSEGTLCFVSKVVLNSVKDYEYKASALLFYEDIHTASQAITKIASLDRSVVVAAELMDYECLLSASSLSDFSSLLEGVSYDTTCILLQTQSDNIETTNANIELIKETLKDIPTNRPSLFSSDEKECALWWKLRKSLLPLSAKNRPKQTVVITEDVCFTIERFCDGVSMIKELFVKHDFKGIIFGHALSGNLHFIITPNLSLEDEVKRFVAFMKDLANEVVAIGGSIKAEHGTGRMVAPFVELEWGEKAYNIHRRIKEIFDPFFLLNPDVIISNDKDIYAKNFKQTSYEILAHADKGDLGSLVSARSEELMSFIENCMDCGFCERACPSKFLTLTPRQRIASIKEIMRLQNSNDPQDREDAKEMLDEYKYYGITTCATCSMCSTLCPLEIDSAHIATTLSRKKSAFGSFLYEHMGTVSKIAKTSLYAGAALQGIFGKQRAFKFTKAFHDYMLDLSKKVSLPLLGFFPVLPTSMPKPNHYSLRNRTTQTSDKKIIYFSTCINRTFKTANNDKSLQEVVESICKKAHISVIYPEGLDNMCCGKAFSNIEGLNKASALANRLLHESNAGEIPIVVDHSACYAHMLKEFAKDVGLKIMDITEFIYEATKELSFVKTNKDIVVHQMCALKKNKKQNFIIELSKKCSDHVHVIESMECCGFSGYKGIFHQELNQSSLKTLKKEISSKIGKEESSDIYAVSSSSTCEIGLCHFSNMPFYNIAYVVDQCLE